MSKLKSHLEKCVSIVKEIQERQQLHQQKKINLEAKAKKDLEQYGVQLFDDARIPGMNDEKAAAQADIADMKKRLSAAVQELAEEYKAARSEFTNAGSIELSNVLKVVELTGATFSNAEAVGIASGLKGDFVSMQAVAAAFQKAENGQAAAAVLDLVPDIPGLVSHVSKLADPNDRNIHVATTRLVAPFFSAAEKMGDDIGSSNDFTEVFERENWLQEAGL